MSTAREPGGAPVRRDNGLVPARWTALAALDPAASDAVLAALARRGVAGLVEPRRGAAGAGSTPGSPPTGPAPGTALTPAHDLLWVDAGRRTEAEGLLVADFAGQATVLPDGPDAAQPGTDPPPAAPSPAAGPGRGAPLDEDAAWAEIVAGWDREDAGGPVPAWPVDEDVAEPGQRAAPAAPRPPQDEPVGAAGPPHAVPGAGPRDHVPGRDPAEDHYVPPPPPPLPRLRKGTVAALAVLALGVVLLFAPGLVGLWSGDAVAVTGIACIVGSVAALVHGMRDRGAGRDGWDDGAVV